MNFSGLKQKFTKYFFKKKLSAFLETDIYVSDKIINTVVVFIEDESERSYIEHSLLNLFKLEIDNIHIINFQKERILNNNINVIGHYDFDWFGNIKSENIENILTKKPDLLINYCKVDNIYFNLLILQCKNSFRVGLEHLDNRFYNLIINCVNYDLEQVNFVILKYLKVLKKI